MHRLNKTILACVLLLAGLGLLSIWTDEPPGQSLTRSTFVKQATFLAAGLALMALIALPNYQHYRRGAYFLYGVCAVALAALLVVGRYTRGARGWFAVGPINVQPAEFMKIAMVLALARSLMYAKDLQRGRALAIPIVLTAVPALLVLLQPDLGTAILFVPTLLAMLWASGARKLHLAAMVAMLLVAAPAMYFFTMKDYQRNRLIAFAVPDRVPADLSYQQKQSKAACASGETFGRGLGESGASSPFYVPDRRTDFVYSIIAEEMGFAGAAFMLAIFAVYYFASLRVAWLSREPFGKLTVVGVTTLLATQTFINLGMTLGVAPITGVTLPFVSYGGSSLLMCALSAGLVLNVAARWQPAFSSNAMAGGSTEIRDFQPQEVKWLPH